MNKLDIKQIKTFLLDDIWRVTDDEVSKKRGMIYNAIKIVTGNGHRIGYVPKDMTQSVREFVSKLPCQCYCYIGINNGTFFTDCYIKK